jgi:hypothetical protein
MESDLMRNLLRFVWQLFEVGGDWKKLLLRVWHRFEVGGFFWPPLEAVSISLRFRPSSMIEMISSKEVGDFSESEIIRIS